MPSYRTDHARARGLGSAKHGAAHWIAERVSAIALIPLCVWIVFAAVRLSHADYSGAVNFVAHPVNAALVFLLVVVSYWHMHAGMRVVVEDYVQDKLGKAALLLLNLFVCAVGATLAAFSILKVAFTLGSY